MLCKIFRKPFFNIRRKQDFDDFSISGAGFTFVELLIVIVTMSLLFGLGAANYRDFARRQSLESATRSLKGDLRLAQQLASSGSKPAGCGTLDGYQFRVGTVPPKLGYMIEPVCNGVVLSATKTVEMRGDIYIGAPSVNPIFFIVLERGTNIPVDTSTTITLAQLGNIRSTIRHQWEEKQAAWNIETIDVVVTSGGEIQ